MTPFAHRAALSAVDDTAAVPEIQDTGESGTEPKNSPLALTPNQAAFAAHYVDCGNGAEAARRAGYSVASARYAARDNLQDSRIRHRIRALAAAAEATRRDEATYLLQMLNAAMEMALAQGQPNTMIRALAQMARITGHDRPPRAVLPEAADEAADGAADGETDGDAVRALHSRTLPGLIQDALADSHLQQPESPAEAESEEPSGPDRANADILRATAPTIPHISPHPEDFSPTALPCPQRQRGNGGGPGARQHGPLPATHPSIHPRGHSG